MVRPRHDAAHRPPGYSMTRIVRLCAASFLCASSLPGLAQSPNAAGPAAPVGQETSAASARSDAALVKAERAAATQRRADEERYRRRDSAMRKSLGGICSGC